MSVPKVFRKGREAQVPVRREREPFWTLQNEVNRLFEDFWRGSLFEAPFFAEGAQRFSPHVDVVETDEHVEVTAELPGLDEKDFELHLAGDQLTLRGEKRAEHEQSGRGWHRTERSYGSFQRTLALPCEVDADHASAEFKNGILKVRMPKVAQAQARRITVKGG